MNHADDYRARAEAKAMVGMEIFFSRSVVHMWVRV